MRTQTIMESVNIVVDDFCDFSKFSKENSISSPIEETGEEAAITQSIATPSNTKTSPSKSVATTDKPEVGTVNLCSNR